MADARRERDALRARLESAETTISKQAAKIPASIIAIQALSPGEARDLLAEIGGMLRAALGAAGEEQER